MSAYHDSRNFSNQIAADEATRRDWRKRIDESREALLAQYPALRGQHIGETRDGMSDKELIMAANDLRDHAGGQMDATWRNGKVPPPSVPGLPPQIPATSRPAQSVAQPGAATQPNTAPVAQPAAAPAIPSLAQLPKVGLSLQSGQETPVTPNPPTGQPATPQTIPNSQGNPALDSLARTPAGYGVPTQVQNPTTGRMEPRMVYGTPDAMTVARNLIPGFDQKTPAERAAAIRGMGNSGNVGTVVARENASATSINAPLGQTVAGQGQIRAFATTPSQNGSPDLGGVAFARIAKPGEQLATSGRISDGTTDMTKQTMANVAASGNPELDRVAAGTPATNTAPAKTQPAASATPPSATPPAPVVQAPAATTAAATPAPQAPPYMGTYTRTEWTPGGGLGNNYEKGTSVGTTNEYHLAPMGANDPTLVEENGPARERGTNTPIPAPAGSTPAGQFAVDKNGVPIGKNADSVASAWGANPSVATGAQPATPPPANGNASAPSAGGTQSSASPGTQPPTTKVDPEEEQKRKLAAATFDPSRKFDSLA